MKIDYTPLKMLENINDNFDSIKNFLIETNVKGSESLTRAQLVDMLVKYKNNDITHALIGILISGMSKIDYTFIKKIKDHTYSAEAELNDVFMFPIILENWSKSKQVFKPDPDFADALLHTDKLCISSNMIDHLPCNLFYVDLTGCEAFSPIDGVFVYVTKDDNKIYFNIWSIDKNLTYFSFYLDCLLDDNNCAILQADKLSTKEVDYSLWKPLIDPDTINESAYSISRVNLNMFILQFIAYLSIEQPQLTESDLTKNTYKKPSAVSKVKNKWSEVRIQDVGLRYGTEFRKTIKTYKQESIPTGISNRKSPIPHFRCAHWHKFWVGKGRQELLVKWIEPIFVGNGDNQNVVVHKVKKN